MEDEETVEVNGGSIVIRLNQTPLPFLKDLSFLAGGVNSTKKDTTVIVVYIVIPYREDVTF